MSINHLKAYLADRDPDDLIKVSKILELLAERVNKPPTFHGPAKGELNHSAQLTEDDIRAIRAEAAKDMSHGWSKRLAEKYNVWDSTITKIVRRERWKHVD